MAEEVKDIKIEPVNPEPPKSEVQSSGLRSISDLFKGSWEIFTKGWVKFLIFALISLAISIGAFVILIITFVGTMAVGFLKFSLILEGEIPTLKSFEANWPVLIVIILIIVFVAVVVAAILSLANNKLVYNVAEQKNEGIKAAFKFSFKHVFAYILVIFLTAVGLIFGYMLLIIPGIILTVFLSLVTPVFILEEARGMKVLKRSWTLVKGNFWHVLGRLFLLVLIAIVISSLSNMKINPGMDLVMGIVVAIIQFIVSYFTIAYTYLIYRDLSAAK